MMRRRAPKAPVRGNPAPSDRRPMPRSGAAPRRSADSTASSAPPASTFRALRGDRNKGVGRGDAGRPRRSVPRLPGSRCRTSRPPAAAPSFRSPRVPHSARCLALGLLRLQGQARHVRQGARRRPRGARHPRQRDRVRRHRDDAVPPVDRAPPSPSPAAGPPRAFPSAFRSPASGMRTRWCWRPPSPCRRRSMERRGPGRVATAKKPDQRSQLNTDLRTMAYCR